MIVIGEQIKKLRTKENKSQDWLAEQLFFSRQAISKWESGDSFPDIETCEKLSKIFNVSLDYLLLGRESDSPMIDMEEFYYDPNKKKYIKKNKDKITNVWEFLAEYWWLVFPFAWALSAIIS